MNYLVCDADGCDYQGDHGELRQDLVGTPCPKCGADLLTQRDFEDGMRLQEKIDFLVGQSILSREMTNDAIGVLEFHTHNGKANISIKLIEGSDR